MMKRFALVYNQLNMYAKSIGKKLFVVNRQQFTI